MKRFLLLPLAFYAFSGLFAQITVTNERSINSAFQEYSPAFYGKGLVFVAANPAVDKDKKEDTQIGRFTTSIFLAKRTPEGVLQRPLPFAEELTTKFYDGPMSFNATGDMVFFTRSNLKKGKPKAAKDGKVKLKIYTAVLTNGQWTNITELPFCDGEADYAHPAISADGRRLFFSSNRSGGQGGMDLYISINQNGTWGEPVNLGPKINTAKDEIFPFSHTSGALLFSSNGRSGIGGLDIFSTKQTVNGWLVPTALPESINSTSDDFGLILNEDRTIGYFASNRASGQGDDDIYNVSIPNGLDIITTSSANVEDDLFSEKSKTASNASKPSQTVENQQNTEGSPNIQKINAVAEKAKQDAVRIAEQKRIEEQKRLEEQKLEAARLAEQKRIEEQKRDEAKLAEQKRVADKKREESEVAEKKREEADIAEQRRIKAEIAESKRKEASLAEQKRAEARSTEQKREEARLAEEKKKEAKLAEQKREEDKIAEQKRLKIATEMQKREEARLIEEKKEETRLAEQRMKEAKAADAKREEAKTIEQKQEEAKLAEAKMVEQKREEARLAEAKLAEQKLEKEKLVQDKIEEQKREDARLAEVRREEMRLAEAKIVEQKRQEAKLAEQKQVEDAKLEEQKREAKLREEKIEQVRIAQQKSEESKIAEQKRVEEAKIVAQKLEAIKREEKIEAVRIAQQKREELRIADAKITEQKSKNKKNKNEGSAKVETESFKAPEQTIVQENTQQSAIVSPIQQTSVVAPLALQNQKDAQNISQNNGQRSNTSNDFGETTANFEETKANKTPIDTPLWEANNARKMAENRDFAPSESQNTEGYRYIETAIATFDKNTSAAVQQVRVGVIAMKSLKNAVVVTDVIGKLTGLRSEDGSAIALDELPQQTEMSNEKGRLKMPLIIGERYLFNFYKVGYEPKFILKTILVNDNRVAALLVPEKFTNAKPNIVAFEQPKNEITKPVIYPDNRNKVPAIETQRITYSDNSPATQVIDNQSVNYVINNNRTQQVDTNITYADSFSDNKTDLSRTLIQGQTFELKNIYYGYGDAELSDATKKELDPLVSMMLQEPDMEIEIAAHTDSRGKAPFNLNLSQLRADNIKSHLVERDIMPNRIKTIGYGETLLKNKCADNVDCTEEEHQINRRTELRVLKGGKWLSSAPKQEIEVQKSDNTEGVILADAAANSVKYVNNSANSARFLVVVGTYAKSYNAEKQRQKVVSAGFVETELIQFQGTGYYGVCVRHFDNLKEAQSLSNYINAQKEFEAFVKELK
jgi:outer membrane protein OmpA-like peptidoglycan-associated protein